MPNDATQDTAELDAAGFRARARTVRQASRARIAELRAARASRRKPSAAAVEEPIALDEPPVDTTPNADATAAVEPAESSIEPTAPELETESESESAEPIDAPEAHEAHDVPRALADLPGVGPGLIWLFEEAGVKSLEDLAIADAQALRARLGVLGALLDIESWTALAKEAVREE